MQRSAMQLAGILMMTTGIIACNSETVESTDVENESIWAFIEIVSADGVGSSVQAEFNVGGRNGTNLDLQGGDRVVVRTSAGNSTLTEDTDFFDVDYEGEIEVGASGEQVVVDVVRIDRTNITGSTVTLPDTFDIVFPQRNLTFRPNSIVEIMWEPGVDDQNATISISEFASCTNAQNQNVSVGNNVNVADNGSYSSNFFDMLDGVITTNGCDYRIEIERTNDGTLSSEFGAGGLIRAIQRREVNDMRVEL